MSGSNKEIYGYFDNKTINRALGKPEASSLRGLSPFDPTLQAVVAVELMRDAVHTIRNSEINGEPLGEYVVFQREVFDREESLGRGADAFRPALYTVDTQIPGATRELIRGVFDISNILENRDCTIEILLYLDNLANRLRVRGGFDL